MAPRKAAAGNGVSGGCANTIKVSQNPIAERRTNRRASKGEKPIFKGLTFSIAGKVTATGGNTIPAEKIAGWITAHAGVYVQEVNDDTTHLICSIKEYQKNGPQGLSIVQKALKLNGAGNRCHIVVFDWLEDCLCHDKKKKRRRKETQYTLIATIKRLRNGLGRHEEFKNRFEEGLRASKELCDSKLHKVYFESDGFEYNAVLTRVNVSNEKVITEKYTLYIFESNAKPHHYMFGAKLARSHRPTTYHRTHCHPKTLTEALQDFKHFFYDKTGIVWDNRLEGVKVDGKFVYTPPNPGQPTGSLPDGYAQREVKLALRRNEQEFNSHGSDSRHDGPALGCSVFEVQKDPISAKRDRASESASQNSQIDLYGEYGYQPQVLRQHAQH